MIHYSYVNTCMKITVCPSWCVSIFARLCSVEVRPDYSCSLCVRVHVEGSTSPSPSNSTHWTPGLDWLGTGMIIQWKPRHITYTLDIFGQPLNQQSVRTQQQSLRATQTQTQTRLLWQHFWKRQFVTPRPAHAWMVCHVRCVVIALSLACFPSSLLLARFLFMYECMAQCAAKYLLNFTECSDKVSVCSLLTVSR
jgi:hypothetical protein